MVGKYIVSHHINIVYIVDFDDLFMNIGVIIDPKYPCLSYKLTTCI